MPGGTWTFGDVTSLQTRPGAYFNLVDQAIALLEAGETGTVFVVGRADWGPVDTVQTLSSEGEATDIYDDGLSMEKLVHQAFRGGAATVKALRITGSSGAVAVATLDDVVPVSAMDVTALHEGSRANGFTLTVSAHPVSGQNLDILEDGVVIETFYSALGDNTEFIAVINANSKLISAALNGAADRVLEVASTPMASGDSGTSVAAGDYTAAQVIAEGNLFDVYVQDDDTTVANQDAAAAWADGRRAAGQRFVTVMGGQAAESVSTAQTRAGVQDSEGVVYVHPGFTDDDEVVFIGQEAAARVAGLIAAAGATKSITFNTLADAANVENTLTTDEIKIALGLGVCLLVTDNADSTRVEKGLTTLTTFTAELSKAFAKIRTVAVMDAVQNGLELGFAAFIGSTTNDVDGQKSLIGAGQEFLDTLERSRAIKPGSSIALDDANPPTADQIFVVVGVTPLDSIEQIFTTVFVSP